MNYRHIIRSVVSYKVNIIVKILIISDFLVFAASQLLAPIFAIFITDNLVGAGIKEVGMATALFLIAKSIFEIPVGVMIDKTKSEKDDLYTSVIGTVLVGLVYILYVFISSIWQLYALQILLGIATAVSYPGWYSIFTKHIDKGKEAMEWSLYDVILGIGMAATAALGGFMVEAFGFNMLFIIMAVFTFLAGVLLVLVKNKIFS